MDVKVIKLTDVNLLRRANSFTTHRESKMSLAKAYKLGHSPIRTQIFWVECREIPLYVASQLVRSHIGIQYFQLSKRPDRGGSDFTEVCRLLAEKIDQLTSERVARGHHEKIADEIEALAEQYDRMAPTDVAFICNAEALMNMAHKRLCSKASSHTREVVKAIFDKVRDVDGELYPHLIPQCVYCGGICRESKPCGWIDSLNGQKYLQDYKALYQSVPGE